MHDNSKVIVLPRRDPPVQNLDARPAAHSSSAVPVTSLPLLLRGAPEHLQPVNIAAELLDAGSNERARPIWARRLHEFEEALSGQTIRGRRATSLREQFNAAVRAEGIALKARRRAEREDRERHAAELFREFSGREWRA